MDDIYKNIEDYNPNEKHKTLIIFDDTIADMLSNKKLNPIVTELFIRVRKLNICLVFITQSYFLAPKVARLNCTHYIIMNLPNKRGLKQIASKNSSNDMDDTYKNIKEYNPHKERKILIAFNDMIADMLSNEKLNPIIIIYYRKKIKHFSFFYFSLILLSQKNIRLNSTQYFVMKIPNKRELPQIVLNHSSDIGFQDFINLYKKCTANHILFCY